MHLFKCSGKIFCVKLEKLPLKFYTKNVTHTLKNEMFKSLRALIFKSSLAFLKRPWGLNWLMKKCTDVGSYFHLLRIKAHGSADDEGVPCTKSVRTHCAPMAIDEEFHTTLVNTAHQTEIVVDRDGWTNTNIQGYQVGLVLLISMAKCILRADPWLAPSQWETVLLCNDVSHWLGVSLESAMDTYIQWNQLGSCLVDRTS